MIATLLGSVIVSGMYAVVLSVWYAGRGMFSLLSMTKDWVSDGCPLPNGQ